MAACAHATRPEPPARPPTAPQATALLFHSGKLVVTGAKNEDDARLAARKVSNGPVPEPVATTRLFFIFV